MPSRQERAMCPCHQNPRDSRSGHGSQTQPGTARRRPPNMQSEPPKTHAPQLGLRRSGSFSGWTLCLSLWLVLLHLGLAGNAHGEEGLALSIVYDTSGSMREAVNTADGKKAAKYIIGNRALEQIIARIDHYSTNSPIVKTVH